MVRYATAARTLRIACAAARTTVNGPGLGGPFYPGINAGANTACGGEDRERSFCFSALHSCLFAPFAGEKTGGRSAGPHLGRVRLGGMMLAAVTNHILASDRHSDLP